MVQQPPHPARALDAPRPNRRAAWLAIAFLAGGGLLFSGLILYHLFGYRSYAITSYAMEPTLLGPQDEEDPESFERVRAEVFLSRFGNPKRGEIWAFRAPPTASPEERPFLFRVIGLPGETVEVLPPRLLLDGRTLLSLASFGTAVFVPLERDAPVEVTADGQEATLPARYQVRPLRVVAAPPGFRVGVDGNRLLVNGRAVVEAPFATAPEALDEHAPETDVPEAQVVFDQGEPRLIIAPGERLEYAPGQVLINGTPLVEPYVKAPPAYAMDPLRLGPEEYAVFGDFRNNANDSAVWGPVSRDRFIGHVRYRFWPPERAGRL